jgi:hypothetical protein
VKTLGDVVDPLLFCRVGELAGATGPHASIFLPSLLLLLLLDLLFAPTHPVSSSTVATEAKRKEAVQR